MLDENTNRSIPSMDLVITANLSDLFQFVDVNCVNTYLWYLKIVIVILKEKRKKDVNIIYS